MKKTAKLSYFLLLTFFASVIFYSCKKDNASDNSVPPGQQNISLFLTDDPAFFDKVFVEILSVKVLVDTCARDSRHHDDDRDDSCKVWDTLTITPGIYDLLTLRNGTDTLLAGGNIPEGKIRMIKIQLGDNNSLVKDSITYPLNLQPGTDHYITLKLRGDECDEYQPGRLQLWLDFDVSRSVIKVRNNEFYLRPFIKVFTVKATGSVSGKVEPKEAYPVISIYNSGDTAYALPNHHGDFKVRGLKEGTYTVFVNASNGYADTTITGVEVTRSREVRLGRIALHQ